MSKILFAIILLTHISKCNSQNSLFPSSNFLKADSIAQLYQNNDLKHPDQLARDLTKDLSTEAEKFRCIFRWVTNNISYDYAIFQKKSIKEKSLQHNRKKLTNWSKRLNKKVFRGVLKKKKTICSGYSMLLERMCEYAGIQCVTINGYGRTLYDGIGRGKIDHAWNATRIDGKWYLSDPTWASGFVREDNDFVFYRKFNNNYFLTDPSLFIANHYPSDTIWMLLLDKPSLKDFLSAPIKSGGYLTNKINTYSPEKGIVKSKLQQPVEFKFSSNKANIKNEAVVFIRSIKIKEEHRIIMKRNHEGEYLIDHCFEVPGRYEVDIYINNELTFSYVVNVS